MKGLVPAALCALLLCSCSEPSLNETEMEIINTHLPLKIYEDNVIDAIDPQDLYDDLWECVRAVAKYYERDTEDLYNSPFSSFVTSMMALGGENAARDYNRYVDYCNDHQEQLIDAVNEVTKVLMENPDLEPYIEDGSPVLSLCRFGHIPNMPAYADDEGCQIYATERIDSSNKVKIGRFLMGKPSRPCYNPEVVVGQAVLRMGTQTIPSPVYAIYNEDDETWDVGYDSHEAYNVVFEDKAEVVEYDFSRTTFHPALINSESNVLRNSND